MEEFNTAFDVVLNGFLRFMKQIVFYSATEDVIFIFVLERDRFGNGLIVIYSCVFGRDSNRVSTYFVVWITYLTSAVVMRSETDRRQQPREH